MSYTISSHDADKSVTNEKKEEARENYASVLYDGSRVIDTLFYSFWLWYLPIVKTDEVLGSL
jgi:hypothetical protein